MKIMPVSNPLQSGGSPYKNKPVTGFTLIELLVASGILTLVMLGIYSAFHSGLFSYRNIDEAINVSQQARQVLGRINSDLRNSFVYYLDNQTKFSGDSENLNFLTVVDSYSGQEDRLWRHYAFISYKLEGDKLMRLCRKDQDALNDKSQAAADEMVSNIGSMSFSYGYVGADGKTVEWRQNWDDPKVLPVAVKVKLGLKGKTEYGFERTIYLFR